MLSPLSLHHCFCISQHSPPYAEVAVCSLGQSGELGRQLVRSPRGTWTKGGFLFPFSVFVSKLSPPAPHLSAQLTLDAPVCLPAKAEGQASLCLSFPQCLLVWAAAEGQVSEDKCGLLCWRGNLCIVQWGVLWAGHCSKVCCPRWGRWGPKKTGLQGPGSLYDFFFFLSNLYFHFIFCIYNHIILCNDSYCMTFRWLSLSSSKFKTQLFFLYCLYILTIFLLRCGSFLETHSI